MEQKSKENIPEHDFQYSQEEEKINQIERHSNDAENKIKLNKVKILFVEKKKRSILINGYFNYEIDMKNDSDLAILKFTSDTKFPFIHRLAIKRFEPDADSRVKTLLKYCFPNNLKQFRIFCEKSNKALISDYTDALTTII